MMDSNMKSQSCAVLLSLSALMWLFPFTTHADQTVAERSGLANSSIGFQNEAAPRKMYDWYYHPQAYQPDGLSDYNGDFTNGVSSVALNVGRDRSAKIQIVGQ